jgi:hypothetical protein
MACAQERYQFFSVDEKRHRVFLDDPLGLSRRLAVRIVNPHGDLGHPLLAAGAFGGMLC